MTRPCEGSISPSMRCRGCFSVLMESALCFVIAGDSRVGGPDSFGRRFVVDAGRSVAERLSFGSSGSRGAADSAK